MRRFWQRPTTILWRSQGISNPSVVRGVLVPFARIARHATLLQLVLFLSILSPACSIGDCGGWVGAL
ncbi:hypothetical protein CLOM_g7797 [Closterium sp. NIES-68]|nr:hypothetical protein CLOM_g7797 [Closterium sp. NIES-68]GJP59885.1 hypothetical protein CLOP_g15677 [Closterium sp. NIES-67]